jgi:putative glutamine amidotransferase
LLTAEEGADPAQGTAHFLIYRGRAAAARRRGALALVPLEPALAEEYALFAAGPARGGTAARPAILIAGAPAYDSVFERPSVFINKAYAAAVSAGGGLPLLAPGGAEAAAEYCKAADALVLTGSAHFVPRPELLPRLIRLEDPVRYTFDKALYGEFKRARKPILGICLGHQMINTYEGGSLLHDFKLTGGVEHMLTAHEVASAEGSVLRSLFGEKFTVNSRHNDAIGSLAESLTASAVSPDGAIEAIEHRENPIYAVQWHPERQRGATPEPPDGPDMTPLFTWFVGQCAR